MHDFLQSQVLRVSFPVCVMCCCGPLNTKEADKMCVGCEAAVAGLFPFILCPLVFVSVHIFPCQAEINVTSSDTSLAGGAG